MSERIHAAYHELIRSTGLQRSILSENLSKVIHIGHVEDLTVIHDGLAIVEGSADNILTDTGGEVILFGSGKNATARGHSRIIILGGLELATVDSTGQITATEGLGETIYLDEQQRGVVKPRYEVSENTMELLKKLLI